jgi:hypothetical protein
LDFVLHVFVVDAVRRGKFADFHAFGAAHLRPSEDFDLVELNSCRL